MDQQPVAGGMAQRPQPLGGRVPRPVDFCGILHGQDYRDSAQAGVCRFDMTLQDVLGGDAVIIKETIGGFQHAASATRFRQSSSGMLSSGISKFHQACGAPLVAEVGVGKFVDGPVGVGDDETHARLLYTRVALGDTRKGSSPQDTPRGSKLKIVGNWQVREQVAPHQARSQLLWLSLAVKLATSCRKNARGERRPEAEARRRLLAVGSSAMFG